MLQAIGGTFGVQYPMVSRAVIGKRMLYCKT